MKLLELRTLPESDRPVKAFADVELDDGTVIREFRVIQEPKRWPNGRQSANLLEGPAGRKD